MKGEVDHFARISHTSYGSVTIKVGTNTNMIDTHNVDSMLKMGYRIHHCCLTTLLQEALVHCDMSHTALLCQRSHLVVGKVARNVTECFAIRMTTYDWHRTNLQRIVKTLLSAVA